MLRWEFPEPYRWWHWSGFLFAWSVVSLILFVAMWMGWGNCAASQCWGDPISFADALSKVPKILLVVFAAWVVIIGLSGIRSGHGSI